MYLRLKFGKLGGGIFGILGGGIFVEYYWIGVLLLLNRGIIVIKYGYYYKKNRDIIIIK